jgi:hypothetical protein
LLVLPDLHWSNAESRLGRMRKFPRDYDRHVIAIGLADWNAVTMNGASIEVAVEDADTPKPTHL